MGSNGPNAEPAEGIVVPMDGDAGDLANLLLAEKAGLEATVGAQNDELAVLRRDNQQLLQRLAELNRDVVEWQAAFGVPGGQTPTQAAEGHLAKQKELEDRVGKLQGALANVDPVGQLPAYGHLLLMTRLAKVAGMSQFMSAPDQINDPNGDVWMSYLEEITGEDGQPARLVVVRHEPGSYGYNEAVNRLTRLDGEQAQALKEDRAAKEGLSKAPQNDHEVLRAYETRARAAKTRLKEIRDEIEIVKPRTIAKGAREWRFSADLDGLRPRGEG